MIAILKALDFTYSHTAGGHHFYKGVRQGLASTVTVDEHLAPFGPDLVKYMANQARCTKKEFYGATEKTAKKIR